MVNSSILTFALSSSSIFSFFQPLIHYMHSSCPWFFHVYWSNPCFSHSTMVIDMVFNVFTFKPKLPIFKLIMAMAWNIFTILLLSRTLATISSTYLGVNFCDVSSLDSSFDDTTLSHTCNSWPTSKTLSFVNLGLIYYTIILASLWTLNDGYVKTTYGTWGCCYCC